MLFNFMKVIALLVLTKRTYVHYGVSCIEISSSLTMLKEEFKSKILPGDKSSLCS